MDAAYLIFLLVAGVVLTALATGFFVVPIVGIVAVASGRSNVEDTPLCRAAAIAALSVPPILGVLLCQLWCQLGRSLHPDPMEHLSEIASLPPEAHVLDARLHDWDGPGIVVFTLPAAYPPGVWMQRIWKENGLPAVVAGSDGSLSYSVHCHAEVAPDLPCHSAEYSFSYDPQRGVYTFDAAKW